MRKVLFLLLICVVVVRVIFSLQNPLEGKRIRLNGTLMTEPKEYGTSLRITLYDYTFFVPQNTAIQYGARIVVEGVVKGHDLTKVKVISVSRPHSLLAYARQKILKTIRSSLSEPFSTLLAGATLGAPNIPKTFSEALRKTGTSHIVVASGGNLAILAGFLEISFSKIVKRKIFLPIIALVLLIYSALTGFGSPVVRALIMWLSVMAAQYTGRVVKPFSVLLITILIMLLYKPLWLTDVSFQLSIGATSGIIILGTRFRKILHRIPLIHEALSMSLAAQIGILPVSLITFHEFNVLSPLFNVAVLWTVPYITIIGMFGSVMTLVLEPLGRVVFLISFPFCWYFVNVVSIV